MGKIIYKDSEYSGGGIGGDGVVTPTADTLAKFDSTAHMNSTDMTFEEVENFVEELKPQGTVDFVVEQGTEGIWTYRKWSSGIAECWGYVSGIADISSAWGSCYTGVVDTPLYPANFFIASPEIWCFSQPSDAYSSWTYLSGNGSKDSPGAIRLVRPNTATGYSYRVHIYVIGRWK